MFQYCSKLQTVNLGQINTSSLTKPTSMFYNCPLLETITSASFDTSKITTSATATVFYNCPLLKGAIAFDSTKKG
jgi:surface protein